MQRDRLSLALCGAGGRCAQELWPLAPVRVASGVASLSDLSISVRSYVPSSASGPPAWSLVPASPRPSMDHARGTVSVCASRGRAQTRAAPHDGSHTRGVHGAGAWGREDRSGEAGRGSRDGGRGDPAAAGADDRVSRVCVCDTAERARPSPAVAHTPVPTGHCARARALLAFSVSFCMCIFSIYGVFSLIQGGLSYVKPYIYLGRFINRTRPMREQNKFMDVYRVEGPTCSLT